MTGGDAATVRAPTAEHRWVGLVDGALPVEAVHRWLPVPACGGVVVFTGVVRDHSEGRDGVTALTYEAYTEVAEARLEELAVEATRRWSELGRVALLHRVGRADLGEPTVVVGVSAPHRAEAFEAARFCIDALKETLPVWKREHWEGGSDWSACHHEVRPLAHGASAGGGPGDGGPADGSSGTRVSGSGAGRPGGD